MNESNEEANIPREPWQRLLEESDDGPPETTDARIRAAARRDLAPRGQRWWLPASLAASFVLGVLVVRSEIGMGGRVPMPTQRGGDAAVDARIIDRNEGEQAREPGKSPSAAARQPAKQREEAESDAYGYADSELGQEAAGTGPRVGGPERELKSASEMPDESAVQLDLPPPAIELPEYAAAPASAAAQPAAKTGKRVDEVIVTGSRKRNSTPADVPTQESSWTQSHPAAGGALVKPSAPAPTPEAWYAAIEKLRRDGRIEEADREIERLKKAYPGWLEAELAKQPPP